MTLGDIFGDGHMVAVARNPRRVVVSCKGPAGSDGWWLIRENALPAVVYNQQVTSQDMAGSLGPIDMRETTWATDNQHCWCDQCFASRKFLETQAD